MLNNLSAIFTREEVHGAGRRDILAIYCFMRSILAQFSKPFFSKSIIVIVMMILCMNSGTEKAHVVLHVNSGCWL